MSTVLTPHTKWSTAVVFGVLGSLVVALVVLAFLWPTKTATTQNLPVSVAGPASSVSALESALDKAAPGTFDFVDATDRADAVTQITHRDTYGGIVLGAAGAAPEVLTAPAANASATQILIGVATQLQAQLTQQVTAAGGDASAAKVTTTTVVPLADTDPTGSGLAAASFPITIGGMLGGVLVSFLVVGALRRLAALGGFAVATGLLLTFVLQTWFEYLQGNFWVNAAAMSMSVLATAAFIAGCSSLLGSRGIGVGAFITVLIANPLSAAALPWQFTPAPWGAIGQYMVPGAANWLIRTLSYFPDASTATQWWVLAGWAAFGVVLIVIGHYRSRTAVQIAAHDDAPQRTNEGTAAPAL